MGHEWHAICQGSRWCDTEVSIECCLTHSSISRCSTYNWQCCCLPPHIDLDAPLQKHISEAFDESAEMAQRLRTCTCTGDPSEVFDIHVRWLTTTWNAALESQVPFFILQGHQQSCAFPQRHTRLQIKSKRKLFVLDCIYLETYRQAPRPIYNLIHWQVMAVIYWWQCEDRVSLMFCQYFSYIGKINSSQWFPSKWTHGWFLIWAMPSSF